MKVAAYAGTRNLYPDMVMAAKSLTKNSSVDIMFFDVCSKRKDPMYQDRIRRKKHDDDFFRYFMTERHADMYVTNLVPNIVDHIDYLIGGTLINKNRKTYINRTYYWEDDNLVRELEEKINVYKKKHDIE